MFQPLRGVTPAQVRKLYASAKALGLSDADLHQAVEQITGKESIRALSCEEASRVIDRLVVGGVRAVGTPRPRPERGQPLPSNVIELATDKQINMIGGLLRSLGWGIEDEYFRACVKKAIGRANIRTKDEASDVIDMLRDKMKELGIDGQAAPSRRGRAPGDGAADLNGSNGGQPGGWDCWDNPIPNGKPA